MSYSVLLSVAVLALQSTVSASPTAISIRAEDPCAQWCDPWFAIPDALDACNSLVSDKAANFQMCSGCSISHGGSIDSWAADYYGSAGDTDYNYMTDCKSCYNVSVPAINFGAVAKVYSDAIAVNKTSSVVPVTLPSSASNSSAKASGTKVAASLPSSATQSSFTAEALNDTSAASTNSRLSVTVLLALFAAFVGASI